MPPTESTPTSKDVGNLDRPVLIVPIGSWEQHGPHLPLDTDTRIAVELVDRVCACLTDGVRGPTITVSASGEHAGFPGTLSVGGSVLTNMIVELVRSASWAKGVVFVNGHGGNQPYLDRAVRNLDGQAVLIWSPPLVDPRDSHAGYVETSILLAIDPTCVRVDEYVRGITEPLENIMTDLYESGIRGVSSTGILGDPTLTDIELGQRLLDSWTELLLSQIDLWRH